MGCLHPIIDIPIASLAHDWASVSRVPFFMSRAPAACLSLPLIRGWSSCLFFGVCSTATTNPYVCRVPSAKLGFAWGCLRGLAKPPQARAAACNGKDESAARFGRAAECPSVSRGHERRGVKGAALARPNTVWYTVTIPKGVAPALMVPSWECDTWQLPLLSR